MKIVILSFCMVKKPSFALQKTAFYTVKDGILEDDIR